MRKRVRNQLMMLAAAAAMAACGTAYGEGPEAVRDLFAELEAMPAGHGLWHTVDRWMVTVLFEVDRGEVIRALEEESEALPVVLGRFDAHVRAGHRAQAAGLIPQITGHPDFRRPMTAVDMLFSLEQRREGELAVALVRACPTPNASRLVVEHVVETEGEAAADELLEHLAGAGRDEWLKEWVRFRRRRGTAESMFAQLREAVIEGPGSIEPARRYLIAAGAESQGREVDWIGEACKPRLAVDCYLLAWEVRGESPSHSSEAAIKLLKRSLSLELTEEDTRRFSSTMAAPPRVNLGLLLRARTEELLAECYQETGRADLAQPLVEKLAKLEIDGMPLHMLRLAGQVQAATGQRVVQGMVVEEEQASKDSPKYWLGRAEYFMGRQEDGEARAAFEKALGLCARERPEDWERGAAMRLRVVQRYVWYLRRQEAFGDAAALVRAELRQAPAGSELARRAMWLLADMDRDRQYRIEPGDELLWSALASMPVWDAAEERVLSRMVENAGQEGREEVIAEAEGLCWGAHPSRAQHLGNACRQVAPERAVVLLRDAEARLEDEQEKGWVSSSLFHLYVELGWVEEAERQFAVALPRWPLEGAEQLARVAQVAAEKGDDARAMRVWRRVANMDGRYLGPLPKLAEAGLRERLRGFYEEWGESDRESWVPEAALGML